MANLRLVQFTDPHLFGDPAGTLRGVVTLASLERTVAAASHDIALADAVLVTGDLVQEDAAGYEHFARVFGALGKPVLCIPGNHDEPQAMRRQLSVAPFAYCGQHDFGAWRLIMLDTFIPNSAAGRLSSTELQRLERAIVSAAGRHVAIALHHQPVDMDSHWLDEVGLENSEELFALIERHNGVRALLWGHVHQQFDALQRRVRLLATPSTCGQFLPRAHDFTVDVLPPAYRALELHDNGALTTRVHFID